MATHLALVGNELALRPIGEQVADQAGVNSVAAEGVAGLTGDLADNGIGGINMDGDIGSGEGLGKNVRVDFFKICLRDGTAVELAVAVGVKQVAGLIGVVGLGELADKRGG
jgi:hypothetical protein